MTPEPTPWRRRPGRASDPTHEGDEPSVGTRRLLPPPARPRVIWRFVCLVMLVWSTAGPLSADARSWSWLGVRIRDLSEFEMDEITKRHGIREGYGVVIVAVLDESPAGEAGVESGDLVVALGPRPIVDTRTFQRLIGSTPAGDTVALTVLRRGGRQRVSVQLAEMPAAVVGERVAAEFGFFLRQGVVESERGGAPDAGERGAVVADVLRGSRAEQGGLEAGDVLTQVEEEPVATVRAAVQALARLAEDRPLRLRVSRGPLEERTLTLDPPPAR